MEDMSKLKDMLCRELGEYTRKDGIESYDLDNIHKLTDTIKNLDKIEMLEDGGYSQARGGDRGGRGRYSREGSYGYEDSFGDNDGYSQARRRRDERGRYSRDDGRDSMVNRLEEMMSRAGSDHDREAIRRCMEQLRGM